jgi:hypothetical protein
MNFFKNDHIVTARVTTGAGDQLCACSVVVPIDDYSLYCTLESATEFKGFLRVTIFDQTSDATPESSISTVQQKQGIEIEPTLPFFQECLSFSRNANGMPLGVVKNRCNACCNEACLSAHPKYLVKRYQVRQPLHYLLLSFTSAVSTLMPITVSRTRECLQSGTFML